MFARLTRMLPLVVLLLVLALVVYLVLAYKYSPNRAKEILIKLFLLLTSILMGFFGLVGLYSWFESNKGVFELALGFFLVAFVGFVITLVCRMVFLARHPQYRKKPTKTRRLGSQSWWHRK